MSVIIVNTEKIAHYSIKGYKGLVTANQVVGANLFADMFAGFTDVVLIPNGKPFFQPDVWRF